MLIASGSFKAIEMIAYNCVKTSHEAGVVYSELQFSPIWLTHSQLAPDKITLTYDEVVHAVVSGLGKGNKDFGVEYSLIICFQYGKPG